MTAPTSVPSTAEEFHAHLTELEQRFADLKPILEMTVRDPALGVEGHLVCWNVIPGESPFAKGGTRITPTVSLEETRRLAQAMALKNAAAGLPMGGSKSGLVGNPDEPGFEKKYRRFVSLLKPVLYENGGCFGGFGFDIGARPEHPIWACDELRSTRCFTGKPVELGGTDYDNEGIAGLGVAEAAWAAIEHRKLSTSPRYAIQGMGAMGAAIYRYFRRHNAVPTAISDPRLGGTVLFDRPEPEKLREALVRRDFDAANAAISECGFRRVDAEEILYLETDVLFPAAVQDVITVDNAARIAAKLVCEGANCPCTPAGRRAMFERGILVIPDIIANPGGVIAAYIELTSKITNEENARTKSKVAEAKAYTREKIRSNVFEILSLADSLDLEPAQVGRWRALKAILGERKG